MESKAFLLSILLLVPVLPLRESANCKNASDKFDCGTQGDLPLDRPSQRGGSNVAYSIQDELGNTNYRQELRYENGNIRGHYGYTDVDGVRRLVQYVADSNGFRAVIETNEPGVGKNSPADVTMFVKEPPAAVVARWLNSGRQKRYVGGGDGQGGYGGGAGGAGGQGSYGSGAGGLIGAVLGVYGSSGAGSAGRGTGQGGFGPERAGGQGVYGSA